MKRTKSKYRGHNGQPIAFWRHFSQTHHPCDVVTRLPRALFRRNEFRSFRRLAFGPRLLGLLVGGRPFQEGRSFCKRYGFVRSLGQRLEPVLWDYEQARGVVRGTSVHWQLTDGGTADRLSLLPIGIEIEWGNVEQRELRTFPTFQLNAIAHFLASAQRVLGVYIETGFLLPEEWSTLHLNFGLNSAVVDWIRTERLAEEIRQLGLLSVLPLISPVRLRALATGTSQLASDRFSCLDADCLLGPTFIQRFHVGIGEFGWLTDLSYLTFICQLITQILSNQDGGLIRWYVRQLRAEYRRAKIPPLVERRGGLNSKNCGRLYRSNWMSYQKKMVELRARIVQCLAPSLWLAD